MSIKLNGATSGSVTLDVPAVVAGGDVTLTLPGGLSGYRNVLINGNPIINQRGYVSGTATTGANQYTLDRWRVVTSGQSITWTTSGNVRTVTAPAGGVEQVVEGLNLFSETYTLSWTGTATATVNGAAVTNGGQVVLSGGSNATVKFSNGTFSLAQLEMGSTATPFEHKVYSDELARCQRYYEEGDYYIRAGVSNASITTSYYTSAYFMVEKRAIPTVTGTNDQGTFSAVNIRKKTVGVGRSDTVANTNNSGTFIADAEL
jgi:hypothetical protein